jgi:hypothetical protein
MKMIDKAHVIETDSLEYVVREKALLVLLHEPVACPFIVQVRVQCAAL